MNFKETIALMGYNIRSCGDGVTAIAHERNDCSIVIIFNAHERVVHGYIEPNIIKTQAQMESVIKHFTEMQRNLKTLSNLSGYRII